MHPYIHIGVTQIPTYLVLFFIGFAIMVIFARKLALQYNYPQTDILHISLYGGLGLLIGAKFMYFITKLPGIFSNLQWYIESLQMNLIETLEYSFGGMVFYGGVIGSAVVAFLYCRRERLPFTPVLDIITPFVPFVHGMGRIGCFMSGCCYGKEYNGIGSVQFPSNDLIPELDDVRRIPVQLIEAGLNFLMSAILLVLAYKAILKTGQLLGIYIVYYTIARFFIEMLRGDEIRGVIYGISTSQIISVLLFPIGIVLLRGKWLENKLEKNIYSNKDSDML